MALITAALLLVAAQERNSWDEPIELAKGSMEIPWHVESDGETLHAISLTMNADRSMGLKCYRSADAGKSWKVGAEVDLDQQNGPPALRIRKGRLDGLFLGRDRKLEFRSFDVADGKASEPVEIAIDGVDRFEDDMRAELIEHRGALYYKGAHNGGPVVVLKSSDAGRTWSRVGERDWGTGRTKDGVFFAIGDALHLVHGAKEKGAIVHRVSSDEGKTWKEAGTGFKGAGERLMPLCGAASGKNGIIVFASMTDAKSARLHTMVSADGGATWDAGGDVMETAVNDALMFRMVTMSGRSAAFVGLRGEGERREDVEGVVIVTEDGGKSWKDVELHRGLARRNFFPAGAHLADGSLGVFVLNAETFESFMKPDAENYVLFRRWGKVAAAATLTDAERASFAKCVDELKSDDVGVRGKATETILALGTRARAELEAAIAGSKDAEVKAALQEALKKLLPVWRKR